MKVQNTVTLEQAQKLDEAIKGAGLEWPGIEWDCKVYKWTQNLNGDQPQLVLRVCDVDAINDEQPPAFRYIDMGIPAPNLAELAEMLVPSESVFGSGNISIPYILTQLLFEVVHKTKAIKTHWETLKP